MDDNYQKLLKSMPQDHLSPNWLVWIVKSATSDSTLIQIHSCWVQVRNYKFSLGDQDTKYKLKMAEHFTFFCTDPAQYMGELEVSSLTEMFELMNRFQRKGFYIYINADLTRTIDRFHWHAVKWAEEKGKPVPVV